MKYIVLIADICEPKTLDGRDRTQQNLIAACSKLNRRRIALGLVSPFTLMPSSLNEAGEFQAVFRTPDELWTSIFELEFAVHPLRLRYGIGVGEIATKINDQTTIGMDGEAFVEARACLDSLRVDGKHFRVQGLQERDRLVRHSLDLVSHLRSGWRENRIGTFLGLLKASSAAETATYLSISEQAVYRNVRDGGLNSIAGLLEDVSGLISEQRSG